MAENASDEVDVIGVPRRAALDLYHALLRLPWKGTLAVIVLGFLGLNVVFGSLYWYFGGVAHAEPGSFPQSFFFSVETMATIGYGEMYPQGVAAHVLVVVESVVSLVVTALSTGLVFAKFSLPISRLVFASRVTIAPMDGVPTLMLRVGNSRRSTIVEAQIRVAVVRTEITLEGTKFYRMYDLKLVRDRSPAVNRTWNVLHRIDESSPFFGLDPEAAAKWEIELMVSITGVDDTSLQPAHGRHRYVDREIVWGARPADMLSEEPNGRITLDLRQFDKIVPTKPTATFPFPREPIAEEALAPASAQPQKS